MRHRSREYAGTRCRTRRRGRCVGLPRPALRRCARPAWSGWRARAGVRGGPARRGGPCAAPVDRLVEVLRGSMSATITVVARVHPAGRQLGHCFHTCTMLGLPSLRPARRPIPRRRHHPGRALPWCRRGRRLPADGGSVQRGGGLVERDGEHAQERVGVVDDELLDALAEPILDAVGGRVDLASDHGVTHALVCGSTGRCLPRRGQHGACHVGGNFDDPRRLGQPGQPVVLGGERLGHGCAEPFGGGERVSDEARRSVGSAWRLLLVSR